MDGGGALDELAEADAAADGGGAPAARGLPAEWLDLLCLKRISVRLSGGGDGALCLPRRASCGVGSVSAWLSPARVALLLRLRAHADALARALDAELQTASVPATTPHAAPSAFADWEHRGGAGARVAAGAGDVDAGWLIAVDVARAALLCSTDEEAPGSGGGGSGDSSCGAAPAPGVPVLEAAATDARARVTLARARLSAQLKASLLADVYSVDKLGWEPAVEPWAVRAALLRDGGGGGGAGAGAAPPRVSLSSPSLLQCTLGPSAILAAAQLRLMAAGAAPAGDGLLAALAASSSGDEAGDGSGSNGGGGGGGCWLVNETGAPLALVVADALTPPAAAAAQLAGGGAAGVAASDRPAPLRVRDPVAANFGGRWVERPDGSNSSGEAGGRATDVSGAATPAPGAGRAAGGGVPSASPVLYLQVAGQRGFFGPVPLRQQGRSLHTLRGGVSAGGGAPR